MWPSTSSTATRRWVRTPSWRPRCASWSTRRRRSSSSRVSRTWPAGCAAATTSDETQFSGCGGFSVLWVQVSNVNLPDGTRLLVTLDFGAVGFITLRGGSGTMAPYNMGRFGVPRDQIRVNSALPDVGTAQQILIGGSFVG